MVAGACVDNGPRSNNKWEVEVAPGEWLTLENEVGRAWFRCQWNGKTVYWPGKFEMTKFGPVDWHIQKCLRSWQGNLYLIYQWNDMKNSLIKFGYCRLDASGTRFEEIDRKDFPRRVATQNIDVFDSTAHTEKGEQVDNLPILRKLDVKSPYFAGSTTSRIWYHLERGLAVEENADTAEEQAKFLSDFVAKYHPTPLPTILKKGMNREHR